MSMSSSNRNNSHVKQAKAMGSRKYLIIMTGLPGSGKSTIAHHLEKHLLGTTIINRFSVLRPYLYSSRWLKLEHDKCVTQVDFCFYDKAKVMAKATRILVLDGCYHTRAKRKKALDFARKEGFNPIVIKCTCENREILRERLQRQIEKRSKKISDKSVDELIEVYVNGFEEVSLEEKIPEFIEYDTIHHEPKIRWTEGDPFVKKLEKVLSYFYRVPSDKNAEKRGHSPKPQNSPPPPQEELSATHSA